MDNKNQPAFEAFDADMVFDESKPEKHLLMAILVSAIKDLKCKGPIGKQAEAFFLNMDDAYLYSFPSICDYLSIDRNKVLQVTGINKPVDKQD